MKNKKIKFFLITFIFIILVMIIIFITGFISLSNRVDYLINDTLEEGNGQKAKVILLAGQSNASGCSLDEYLKLNVSNEKYNEYSNGYDNVFINYYCSGNNISEGFVKCKTNQGEMNGYFGPELSMAEKLHELQPNELFFIIKYAWGATDLNKQWLSPKSFGKTGKIYDYFTQFVDQSINYLISKDYDVEIEAICWMQGESDSFSIAHAKAYETHLSNFIYDIRKKFSRYESHDGIALIDATIADNPVYWVYCDLVNQSKINVSLKSPLNVLIDTNAYGLTCQFEPIDNPDRAHYDSMSQVKLGHLFVEYMIPFL